jgi:hypothetical protein
MQVMLTAPIMKDVLVPEPALCQQDHGSCFGASENWLGGDNLRKTHSSKPATGLDMTNRQGNTGSTALLLVSCLPVALHEFAKKAAHTTADPTRWHRSSRVAKRPLPGP